MAFMSSLPSPILSRHLESSEQEIPQPSDPGMGLAAAMAAGNRGVETRPPGNSCPLGICSYLTEPSGKRDALLSGFAGAH